MATNRYGLDVSYFKEKLKLIVRDIDNYKPSEFFREMERLANAAYPSVETSKKEIAETAGSVDLGSIQHDLTELVGCKFYQIDESNEGRWHGEYDIAKWADRYRGIQNLPKHTVELNNFRNEVDQFVSMIMMVIQKNT